MTDQVHHKVQWVDITENEEGQRLDNFLCGQLKGVPRAHIYKVLRSGEVRVNSRRAKAMQKLRINDRVRIPPVRVPEAKSTVSAPSGVQNLMRRSILYEDDHLIVVAKPSGLAVHGGSGLSLGLIEVMRELYPSDKKLELVHRLDRETSGCLILARSRPALLALQAQLRARSIRKEYLALATGKWPGSVRTVDAPLEKNRTQGGERMVKVGAEGKASVSHFRVERRFSNCTLLRVQIDTGRTHQIRVHSQLVGHPLAGDHKYCGKVELQSFRKAGLKRMFLHAARLAFLHPTLGTSMSIEAPLPEDLMEFINKCS